ncbi:unnamed protein product [Chondrus crispus]|uniref:Uncharacterized protein n=1 Tax=Chondrus crispus TaxID=2769 RepID=R7QDR8_CHOCR|nr:unnamed protein product [Chondrus crispus]CDF36234.1 unnamed protein product [Chondrus crispus]|eukprot:XP_005716053.1 unnamed protein product [Chondrus crispus]
MGRSRGAFFGSGSSSGVPSEAAANTRCCREGMALARLCNSDTRDECMAGFLTFCDGMVFTQGIVFEIAYAAGLRDVNSRRFLIANAGAICRATRGKHLIMSSGARSEMELRGPQDIINLGILFDIPQEHSHNAVKKVAGEAVAHGNIRSQTYKGIVRVEKLEKEETGAEQVEEMEL